MNKLSQTILYTNVCQDGSDEAKAYMKSIRQARKLTNNYEKMKGHENIVMTNTAQIAVPKILLHIDANGKHKIIKLLQSQEI